jgi:hypothetical protein
VSVHVALERPLGEFARPLQGDFTTLPHLQQNLGGSDRHFSGAATPAAS